MITPATIKNPVTIAETLRIPTRIVPTVGTLLAGATKQFLGRNNRQDRVQFNLTNMDPTQVLWLQTSNGVNCVPVYPQRTFAIETTADLQLYNPNANPVQYAVCELYPGT